MNDVFRLVTVTRDSGVALVTGPALDLVRAVVPSAEYEGANPVTVTLPAAGLARLRQIAGRVPADDERYEAAVPVAAALARLDLPGREGAPA